TLHAVAGHAPDERAATVSARAVLNAPAGAPAGHPRPPRARARGEGGGGGHTSHRPAVVVSGSG
ncbi:hypothetical protein, partial [Streptomyces yangpuensis]|uniref:hypothetical protein n=1 Tax=Streptomyces yangpuensis TaxID=1648182 RepID=UPI0036A8E6F1